MKSILRKIFLIAIRAYWAANKSQDCGGDWERCCKNRCRHSDICQWAQEITEELKAIK